MTYVISKHDEGRRFVCESNQQDENGNLLYVDTAATLGLHHVYQVPKSITSDDQEFIIHPRNDALTIERQFEARPGPTNEDVQWSVEHKSTGKVLVMKGDSKEGVFNASNVTEIEDGKFAVYISIGPDLSQNISLMLTVSNAHGVLEQSLPDVIIINEDDNPNGEMLFVDVETSRVQLWIVAVIITIIIVIIAIVIFASCATRKALRKRNGRGVTRYCDYESQRVRVDLADVGQEGICALEDHLMAAPDDKMFHRSDSDCKDLQQVYERTTAKVTELPTLRSKAKLVNNDNDIPEQFHPETLKKKLENLDRNLDQSLEDGTRTFTGAESKLSVNDTVIRLPDGRVLMTSGPTNFPILSPASYTTTPSYTPGRKTSQKHFSFPEN